MGSFDFTTIVAGKDARSAFSAAVAQDLHEYGHDAYSGTIGQKGAFVMFASKPMTDKQAREWLDRNFFRSVPVRKGTRVSFYDPQRDEYNAHGTVLAKVGERFRVQPDGPSWERRKPLLLDADTVEPLPEVHLGEVDDKWGAAGCLPLTKKRFLFFGWAAS